jgi:hypothetical protein
MRRITKIIGEFTLNNKQQTVSPGYKFFAILSVISIVATLWCAYSFLPFNTSPNTETILGIAGFNAALLGIVGIALGRETIEYNWNQRVLAGVCIDMLILIMLGLFAVALFSNLSLTPISLVVLSICTCDIFIRQTILRKTEG